MVFPVRALTRVCLPRLLTTAEMQDEMEGEVLLDIVIQHSASILKLLAGKHETLLIRSRVGY